jgi:hypothetical protein
MFSGTKGFSMFALKMLTRDLSAAGNINFSSEFVVRYRIFTVLGKPWFRDLNFAWSSTE